MVGSSPGFDRRSRSHRCGFTLVELMLAMALLGLFFAVFTPLLLGVARERREAVREQVAWQHAQNLLEDVTHRPWEELTAAVVPPPGDDPPLTGYRQQITVTEVPGPPRCKRVTVTVTWTPRPLVDRTLTLSGWVWPPAETQP